MLTLLLALALTSPRVSLPSSGGGHTIEDEGTPLTTRTSLNFVGAGVSCTDTGTKTQCSIAGGGAGSANVVNVTVAFTSASPVAVPVVVTGQTWVTGTSSIVCHWANLGAATNNTSYVYLAGGLHFGVGEYVAGTGFTVYAYSENGASGNFNLSCTGA